MNKAILTIFEAKKIIKAQKLGHSGCEVSLNLGKSIQKVFFDENWVVLNGEKVSFENFKKLKEDTCYVAEDNELKSVDFFGEDTNIFYKLVPTKDWPTVMLSSVPMHRFKTISPKTSAQLMVDSVSPLVGRVLDTCCGLGYTAITAAKYSSAVESVVVFEKDSNVLRIVEYNPYSEELFSNKKIKLKNADVFDEIKKLPSDYFDRIVHDPPTVSFAKELYSDEFYKEVFRVAKIGAIIYHYCPNPGKTKGTEFWRSIEKMLLRNGFSNCKYNPKASGISCVKQ